MSTVLPSLSAQAIFQDAVLPSRAEPDVPLTDASESETAIDVPAISCSVRSKCVDELVGGDASLFQNADKRSGFDLSMIWDHATDGAASHHDVAAALAGDDKA